MRFPEWNQERAPDLGDIAYQTSGPGTNDEWFICRAYRVVGVEETRSGYRILMERVEFGTVAETEDQLWNFHNLPR